MKKVLFISLAVVLALSVSLMGCGGDGDGDAIPYKNDGWFIEETIGGPDSLDPAWAYDTASGQQIEYVYETLIYYDGTYTGMAADEFVPILATSVPTYNAANNTYTFTIRSDVTFHEGGTLTAEDVEYSFERAMIQSHPTGPMWMFFQALLGPAFWGYGDTNFTAIDAAIEDVGDTVVFTLCDDAWELPFLQVLCGSWGSIVDKEWCIANNEWNGTEGGIITDPADPHCNQNPPEGVSYLEDHMNGTGPWKLFEWDVGNQVVVDINDSYWQGSVPFDKVITKQVDEWTDRKLDLLAGECDYAYVPRQYISELASYTSLTTYQDLPSLNIDAFFMNMDIAVNSSWIGSGALDGDGIPTDFFNDVHIRRAMNYAFDWDAYINDILQGEAVQRGSPIVEGLYGYNPAASMYSLCLTAAEQEFKAAASDVWNTGFKFTLIYNVGNDVRKAACEILADSLYDINPSFLVSILALDWGTGYIPELLTGNLACFQIGWAPDYPHADNYAVPFMHSQGTYAHWQSYGYPYLDTLITDAFYDTNPTTQLAKYYEIQEIYYQDAPGIMLSQALGRRFFSPYIEGFYYNPMIFGSPGPLYYMSKSES